MSSPAKAGTPNARARLFRGSLSQPRRKKREDSASRRGKHGGRCSLLSVICRVPLFVLTFTFRLPTSCQVPPGGGGAIGFSGGIGGCLTRQGRKCLRRLKPGLRTPERGSSADLSVNHGGERGKIQRREGENTGALSAVVRHLPRASVRSDFHLPTFDFVPSPAWRRWSDWLLGWDRWLSNASGQEMSPPAKAGTPNA